MAPAVNNGHRQSSRWLSGEVSSDTFPPWTRGDDIDADTRLLVEAKARGRRHRKRQASDDGIIRAETHQIAVATEFDLQPTTALSEPVPAPSQVDPSTTIASVGPPESASIPSSTSDVAPTTAPADVTTADPVSSTTAPTGEPDSGSDSDADDSGESEGDSGESEGDSGESEDDSTEVPEPTSTGTAAPTLPTVSSITSTLPETILSTGLPTASPDASRSAQQKHHRNVETALTVVGSICGVILLIIGAFIFWRVIKRRRQSRFLKPFIASAKPRRRRERLLNKVPFLHEHLVNRGWITVQDAQYDEKRPSTVPSFDLLGYMPDKPIRAMFTTRRSGSTDVESQERGNNTFGIVGAPYQNDMKGQSFSYQQHIVSPISSDQDPPGSPYQPSESSLSSAFGNGTHIPPTPLHPPPAYRRNEDDRAAAAAPDVAGTGKRDTVYTQTSEASSVPRFRTVSSWVRQQTSRIQEPPMPDAEFTMVGGPNGTGAERLDVPRM